VRSSARPTLGVSRRFCDDSLSYFTDRLDPTVTRQAASTALHRAKRNKAFESSRFIGQAWTEPAPDDRTNPCVRSAVPCKSAWSVDLIRA
jgi:hypothetical protein